MRQKRRKLRRSAFLRNVLLAVVVLGVLAGLYGFLIPQAAPSLPPPKPEVPILIYHSISEGRNLQVPPTDFEAQMKWLADNGFKPITMHQLQQYWKLSRQLHGGISNFAKI